MARTEINAEDQYINDVFAHEDVILQNIRRATQEGGVETMAIGPYEGRLLQLLVSMVNAKKIVEVGTLYGYSALWMARALPEDGKIICLEKDPDHSAKASALLAESEVSERIDIRQGEADQLLADLVSEGPFDVVFIDANKAGYCGYLDWAEKNVRKGGLIIGDNTFLFGHVISGAGGSVGEKSVQVMRDFNRRLADSNKYRSVLIPTHEGLTVAQKLF